MVVSAGAFSFYDLGTLSGAPSAAYDVSDFGNVAVGTVSIFTNEQAFRWTPSGGMVGLGYVRGFVSSSANGVSANGSVVVGYGRTPAGQTQAFRWSQGGGMVGLGWTGGYSSASAVSANGLVTVGEAASSSDVQAFRWTQAGGIQTLGALAGYTGGAAKGISGDGSTIVGVSYSSGAQVPGLGEQAFRWTQTDGTVGLGWLPGYDRSQAIAASTDGSVIIGVCSGRFGNETAFRWTQAEGMMSLGMETANDVSGDGSVIVGSISSGAAIWDAVNGTRDLKQLLIGDGINLNNWTLDSAEGITADGRVITGFGRNGSQMRAWMVVIPEPASATLILVGFSLFRFRKAAVGAKITKMTELRTNTVT